MGRARELIGRLFQRAKYINLGDGIRIPRDVATSNLHHSLSAVWSVVTLLSGHLASIPLGLYQRLPDGGRRQVKDSPIDQALRLEATPGVSAFEMREALVANIELHDIGYMTALAVDGQLRLRAHNTLHVYPNPDRKSYTINIPGETPVEVPAAYMVSFPALSFDAKNPVKMSSLRKRSMSLAISYEQRAESYNRNSSNPSGVVTWGAGYGKLEEAARKRLEKKFEDLYQDVSKAGGVAFMPEGSKFDAVSFNPEQLQMLSGRHYTVQEVARWWGVPPNKIGDLTHATFSNIEHLAIEYVQDSLLRRASKMESILTIALIPPEKRGEYFIEHNLDGLLRGDFKARMDGYAIAKGWGLRSSNDIARLENWNPISKEDGGDTYYMPLNMMPTRQLEKALAGSSEQSRSISFRHTREQPTVRRQITEQFRPLFGATATPFIEKEIDAIRSLSNELLSLNKLEDFKAQVTEWYVSFLDELKTGFLGTFTAFEAEISALALEEISSDESFDLSDFIAKYADTFARRWTGSSRGQVHAVVNDAVDASEDPKEAVETRLSEWDEKKTGKIQQREPIRLESAVSKTAWARAGVQKLRWVDFGDTCPYCLALSGKVVAITSAFLVAGVPFQPTGAEPLIVKTHIGHPPLHDGCDCGLAAEF